MYNNKEIIDDVKLKIAISNFQRKENVVMIQQKKNIFKIGIVASLMIVSVSGMVFAKEISTKIYENFFGTGKGVETAINEGYIENPEMKYENSQVAMQNEENGEKIEDTDTSVKVDDLLMDDFNLSLTFSVKLSDKILDKIKAEDIWELDFTDIVITDENENVVFLGSEKYKEFKNNEKVINTGVNSFLGERQNGKVKLVYNIYTGGTVFPKSKKLNIKFNKINISKDETVNTMFGEGEITLTGNWEFSVDIPEKMYNRKTFSYIEKSSNNPDIHVTQAMVYETGMDVKLKINNAKKYMKRPTTPEIEFWKSLPQDSKLKTTDILNYLENDINLEEYKRYIEYEMSVWDYDKYVVNDEGKRFDTYVGPRETGGGYIDDDGVYETNCTFDLTRHDATDEITVFIDYHGKKAEIILKKVEE